MKQWELFLQSLEKELGKANVDKWLRTLKIWKFDARNIYLESDNSFQLSWFKEYVAPKLSTFKNANSQLIKVHIEEPQQKKKQDIPSKEELSLNFKPLDPIFHLSNFYPANNNKILFRLLCDLARYETTSPNISLGTLNPIYIFGPSGSGKTHLLTALAKYFIQTNKKALYVSADLFTKHVVFSMRQGYMDQFRKTYRNVDVLIIDDIHLFEKKWATQEEFFHTFNTLHTENKQIILASKEPPMQLTEIEPRLISRFEWGLSSSLEPLQKEDFIKLLQLRAKSYAITLKDSLLDFFISAFPSTQDITKAFDTLILRASTPLEEISESDVAVILKDLIQESSKKVITHEDIIKSVAFFYELKEEDLLERAQTKECANARQIAMYLLRSELKYPFTKIGKVFNRDHSTVISSVKKVENQKERDASLKASLKSITKKLEKFS